MEQPAPPIEATAASTSRRVQERSRSFPSRPQSKAAKSKVPASRDGRKACRWSSLLHQSKRRQPRRVVASKSEADHFPHDPNRKPQSPKFPRHEMGARPVGGAACSTNRRDVSFDESSRPRAKHDNRLAHWPILFRFRFSIAGRIVRRLPFSWMPADRAVSLRSLRKALMANTLLRLVEQAAQSG